MQNNGEYVPIYIGKCHGFILTAILASQNELAEPDIIFNVHIRRICIPFCCGK